MVDAVETEKKKENGKCPNCEKDITLEEIKAICTGKTGNKEICLIENDTLIKEAIPHLNKYRKIAGINTCISKAHFLAQLSQESKFYVLEEGFNYYWEALISTFSAFQSEEGRKKAKLWGRKIKDRNTKGYEPVTPANEINIANWAYKDDNKNGSFSSGDGSRYRGRGFKQITWKSNYIDLSDFFNTKMKIASDTSVNWKDNYTSLTRSPTDAMISALAFWKKNNLSNIAANSSDIDHPIPI